MRKREGARTHPNVAPLGLVGNEGIHGETSGLGGFDDALNTFLQLEQPGFLRVFNGSRGVVLEPWSLYRPGQDTTAANCSWFFALRSRRIEMSLHTHVNRTRNFECCSERLEAPLQARIVGLTRDTVGTVPPV